jgi:hypothetical protein
VSWGEQGAADALVESVLAKVKADGMDERPVLAMIYALKYRIINITGSKTQAFTDEKHRIAGLRFENSTPKILEDGCHELGHIIQYEAKVKVPHCEDFTSEVGRAAVIGRSGVLRRLQEMENSAAVVESYLHLLPASQITQRIWEVRRGLLRKIG